MAKIRITLTKSPIGYNKKQRATAQALGLRKLQSSVIQEDTPDIMGKVAAIAHLVKWERLAEAAPVKAAEAPAPKAAEAPAEEAPKRAPKRTAKKDAETADELKPAAEMVSEALKQAPKRAAKKDSEAAPQEQE